MDLTRLTVVLKDLVAEVRAFRLAMFPQLEERPPAKDTGERVLYVDNEESTLESYAELIESMRGLPAASKQQILENLLQGDQ